MESMYSYLCTCKHHVYTHTYTRARAPALTICSTHEISHIPTYVRTYNHHFTSLTFPTRSALCLKQLHSCSLALFRTICMRHIFECVESGILRMTVSRIFLHTAIHAAFCPCAFVVACVLAFHHFRSYFLVRNGCCSDIHRTDVYERGVVVVVVEQYVVWFHLQAFDQGTRIPC
jgi:hypothetical protein